MWASDEAGIKRTCKAIGARVPPTNSASTVIGFIGLATMLVVNFKTLVGVIGN